MLFLFYFNFWVQWEKDLISFFTAFTIYIYQNKDKYIYFNNVLYNTIPYRFFPVYTYTEERQGIMKRSLSWSRIIKNENHRGAILWKKIILQLYGWHYLGNKTFFPNICYLAPLCFHNIFFFFLGFPFFKYNDKKIIVELGWHNWILLYWHDTE